MFEAMDRYGVAVDELLAADLDGLSRDELLDVVRSFETQRRRLAGVDHALIAQLESRGVAHELAARSTSSLLQHMLRLSAGEAGGRVHAARRLGPRRAMSGEDLAPLRAEVAAGQRAGVVSAEQARVICQVLDQLPSATPVPVVNEVEETLVGHAAEHAPQGLRKLAAHTLRCLDPDGPPPSEQDQQRQRWAKVAECGDGSYELRGRLTPECGAAWQAIISALGKPEKQDSRSTGQRTHDAFLEAARRLLNGDLPDCNGLPVTILLTMDINQLESRTGVVTTAHGGSLSVDQALKMATDAGVVPIMFNDSGGVLRYGRLRRFASLGQRYALQARDLRCSFPGCTQPGAWTQIDHTHEWSDGGTTDVDGMCLLCDSQSARPQTRLAVDHDQRRTPLASARLDRPPPNTTTQPTTRTRTTPPKLTRRAHTDAIPLRPRSEHRRADLSKATQSTAHQVYPRAARAGEQLAHPIAEQHDVVAKGGRLH